MRILRYRLTGPIYIFAHVQNILGHRLAYQGVLDRIESCLEKLETDRWQPEKREKEDLKYYFREFEPYEGNCKFQGCSHIHEPGCGVKDAMETGKIPKSRYENYLELYRELEQKQRY